MASWIIRREKLSQEQVDIVDADLSSKHNMWISGFAGSGKSVILVHKAIELLREKPSANIVILVYTQSLVDLFKTGLQTLGHQEIEVKTIYDFMQGNKMYDYIFCDEIQDFTQSMIDEIKHRTNCNIIVAGDKFQSIYEKDVRYHEATIDPQSLSRSLPSLETKTLTMIYRLTRSIIEAINCFFPSMRMVADGKSNAEKVDVNIKLCKCDNRQKEANYAYKDAVRYISRNQRTALLFPSYKECIDFVNTILGLNGKPQWKPVLNKYKRPDFGSLNNHLAEYDIKLMYVGNGYGSLKVAEDKSLGVLMMYQSSKGLDFENVYLPFLNEDLFITYDAEREKTIFMVAMSRSSRNLTITYSGNLYHHVAAFKQLCTEIQPEEDKQLGKTGKIIDPKEQFDF